MSKSASFKHQVSKVKIDNQQPQFSKGTLRNMFLPTKRRWECWGIGVSIALQDFHKKKIRDKKVGFILFCLFGATRLD